MSERVEPNPGEATLTAKHLRKRNNFEASHIWLPYWEAEVSLAADGLVRAAEHAFSMGGVSAAYKIVDDARKYHEEAVKAMSVLGPLYDFENQQWPAADTIREDEAAMSCLAEFEIAAASYQRCKWGPKFRHGKLTKKMQKERNSMAGNLREIPDNELVDLWHKVRVLNDIRRSFWSGQLFAMEGHLIIDEISESVANAEIVSEEEIDASALDFRIAA